MPTNLVEAAGFKLVSDVAEKRVLDVGSGLNPLSGVVCYNGLILLAGRINLWQNKVFFAGIPETCRRKTDYVCRKT